MTRMTRFAVALVATAGGLLATRAARAQDAGVTAVSCASLPNPIYMGGSSAFLPTAEALAAKLAQASTPYTLIYQSTSSCQGVTSVATGAALSGTNGIFFTSDGKMSGTNCTFDTGPKMDVGVSDVFYEACGTNAPSPRPTNLKDTLGPVQAMVFIVPKTNKTGYLSALEGADIWGCSNPPASITTIEPQGTFCRGATSGTQITIAAAIGLDPGLFVGNSTSLQVSGGAMATSVGGYPSAHANDDKAIGFIGADIFDGPSGASANMLIALPFAATGQTMAFYPDSAPGNKDRRNVRDGHYYPWGYEHLMALTDPSTGQLSTNAAKAIGWLTGTVTDPSFDYVQVEGGAGVIPQCAMKVAKANDVPGYLAPYTPADTCNCAFEAAYTGAAPSGCTACTAGGDAGSTCTGGKTCHHGFCE